MSIHIEDLGDFVLMRALEPLFGQEEAIECERMLPTLDLDKRHLLIIDLSLVQAFDRDSMSALGEHLRAQRQIPLQCGFTLVAEPDIVDELKSTAITEVCELFEREDGAIRSARIERSLRVLEDQVTGHFQLDVREAIAQTVEVWTGEAPLNVRLEAHARDGFTATGSIAVDGRNFRLFVSMPEEVLTATLRHVFNKPELTLNAQMVDGVSEFLNYLLSNSSRNLNGRDHTVETSIPELLSKSQTVSPPQEGATAIWEIETKRGSFWVVAVPELH